jgi:4'-phosphopantetheinyl transferase
MPAILQNIKIRELANTRFTLQREDVHLWQTSLDSGLAEDLFSSLSQDEKERADQFHFPSDKNDFVVSRGLLRKVLASYVNIKPDEIRFNYGEKGKPALAEDHDARIHFNLAHSRGHILLGVAQERAIGVDLELIRDDLEAEKIAERFFSDQEKVALRRISPELRTRAFFICWTRKEAYIKARGDGLLPLDRFDVSVDPDESIELLRKGEDPAEISKWSMQSIDLTDNYAAALVVEGNGWRLRRFVLVL